jgi:microcompartment protein CcmL/EutN
VHGAISSINAAVEAGISETVKTVIQEYPTVNPRLKPGENEK